MIGLKFYRSPDSARDGSFTPGLGALAREPNLEPAELKEAADATVAMISIATLDQFDTARSYQQMLSSMVSQLKYDALSDHQVEQAGASAYSSAELSFAYRGSESQDQLQGCRPRNSSVSPHDMAISSVDPLHFLGITPTTQNAGLLHACRRSPETLQT